MRPKRKALESTLESQQIDRRPTGRLGAAAGRHYRPPGYWQYLRVLLVLVVWLEMLKTAQ
jgi:hypothetical protein